MEDGKKKSILFVDDEQKLLDGLKRMLHHMRAEWEMDFVASGKEALALMSQKSFDVIVSDMRMPEMDGAQLLNQVKDLYPNVVRFILSGFSDKEMIMRTLGATDQFLTKPCDPTVLKNAIAGVLTAQNIVDEKELRAMVSKMHSLPTLPDMFVKLRKVLEAPNSSIDDIAKIVSADVTISAKVLQLVNSAFFGLKQRVGSIQYAIMYIGMETLKAVVLAANVFSQFSKQEVDKFRINELYDHSIRVALIARKICSESLKLPAKFIDEVSMACILHDIGKVLFIKSLPDKYTEVLAQKAATGRANHVLEKEIIGTTHAHIGGYLMSVWGLPEEIVRAITYHHSPNGFPHTAFNSISGVYVANTLVNSKSAGINKDNISLDISYLSKLKISAFIGEWEKLCLDAEKQESEERQGSEGKQESEERQDNNEPAQ